MVLELSAEQEAFQRRLREEWENGQVEAAAARAYGGNPRRERAPTWPQIKKRLEGSK